MTDKLTEGDNLPPLDGNFSNGRLERILRNGDFAVTAEIAPPDNGYILT